MALRLLTSLTTPLGRLPRMVWRLHGLDVAEEIVNPWQDRAPLAGISPLGKVPALLLEDGTAIVDSAVIAEHLDSLGAAPLLPAAEPERLRMRSACGLARDVIASGAAIAGSRLVGAELPAKLQDWHLAKIEAGIAEFERLRDGGAYGTAGALSMLDLGVAAMLGFMDFRLAAELPWRAKWADLAAWHDALAAEHAAVRETVPVAPS
ncbi:MAG: glutathione S-transferase family protein [Betaproteobacteria bacterium AqS2]|uniref:Glutathione S-transferase family protein n=1 Tax=Candidatus Amphirhobacter heronislandensis TaxID=1732024 RepID=A0A930UFN9_9GAMM|nr:glutathione S-transferase family protein [Betaproteobacteria bacterium AqS2]